MTTRDGPMPGKDLLLYGLPLLGVCVVLVVLPDADVEERMREPNHAEHGFRQRRFPSAAATQFGNGSIPAGWFTGCPPSTTISLPLAAL